MNKNEGMTVKGATPRNGKLQQYILLQGLAHYEQFQFTWFEVFYSAEKHSISSHTKQKKSVAHKYFQTIGVLIKVFSLTQKLWYLSTTLTCLLKSHWSKGINHKSKIKI